MLKLFSKIVTAAADSGKGAAEPEVEEEPKLLTFYLLLFTSIYPLAR